MPFIVCLWKGDMILEDVLTLVIRECSHYIAVNENLFGDNIMPKKGAGWSSSDPSVH